MVEIAAALQEGDVLFSGIDQLGIFFARQRFRPHAQQAVLAMQEHLFVGGQVIGNPGRQANAEVNVSAFGDIAGHALGHFVTGQFLHLGLLRRVVRQSGFPARRRAGRKCRG